MAETMELKVEIRFGVGSKNAAKLRKTGKLPAIVYGHKEEPITIVLDSHDFTEALHHGHRFFKVKIDGKSENLLAKALQYDHLGKNIIHVDFIRVDMSEVVTVGVPIKQVGLAKGTHEGGIIDEHLSMLEVSCKVTDIPDEIFVNMKELGLGESIHAGDIELPDGTTLATNAEALVLTCHIVAAAKSAEEIEEEEEAPTAPEVITERAEEKPEE